MSDWVRVEELKTLFTVVNDKTKQLKTSDYHKSGKHPIIDQSSDFICGYSDRDDVLFSSPLPIIVFGDHTRWVKYIDFPFIAGADGTQLIHSIDWVDPKFLFYVVQRAAQEIGNFGYDRHLKHLKRYPTSVPRCKTEQKKIATILSTVDEVIEKTEDAIAKYKAIKAGMMQDLFTRGIDIKTGKLRPPFHEAPELYKETELGWIPKEWEVGSFGDICKVKAGYSFKSSEFGTNGHRLIRISNIQEKTVTILEDDVFIKLDSPNSDYELKEGNILIALSGATTGKVGVVARASLPAILNQRVGLFEPQDNTSIDYVYQIVSDESYQKSILENCPSSAQPNVSPKYLETIPIKYAKNKREQELIARLLKSLDSTIENEYNQLKKCLNLKQGMMADLLTGKVRVNQNKNKVENS